MSVKVDNLIRSAGDNGWDFFAQLLDAGVQGRPSSLSPEALAEAERRAMAWATWYGTDDGRRCIDHLVAMTMERATWVSHLGLPMEQAYGHGCNREGQNAIVHIVLKMIAEGRKEHVPERT